MHSRVHGFALSETMFRWVLWIKEHPYDTTTQVLPREHFTLDMISVNHSISQWFQRRLVYVFDWFHVNLLNLNVFRQLLVRFMDFITLHLTTVSVL